MKKLISLTIFFVSFVILAAAALFVSPYYLYNRILKNDFYSDWYSLPGLNKEYLIPAPLAEVSSDELGNQDLWQKFHLMDVLIPLPVRNPFYFVAPVLKYVKESKKSEFGIKIFDAKEREISKIFFMQNKVLPDELNGQKLFKLPLVKKYLRSIPQEKIWHDMFNKKMHDWSIPFSEMIYNLYLLHLRVKLLPKDFLQFSMVKKSSTAIIELPSKNKDYTTELIFTKKRGVIYSFVLISEKGNQETQLVRSKLLSETQFQGGSIHLANIIYKEFKGLSYEKQIDHEGMLYLLSAWSHNTSKKEFIKEMIYFLERGEGNQRQLEPIYSYAYERFGQTFANQIIEGINLGESFILQRNVELEKKREEERLKTKIPIIEDKTLSKEQEVQYMLKGAKRDKKTKKNRMIID